MYCKCECVLYCVYWYRVCVVVINDSVFCVVLSTLIYIVLSILISCVTLCILIFYSTIPVSTKRSVL